MTDNKPYTYASNDGAESITNIAQHTLDTQNMSSEVFNIMTSVEESTEKLKEVVGKVKYNYLIEKRTGYDINPVLLSYIFFTNRQRMAFNTAIIITPTSAKIAKYILAIPTAPSARQANFTISAIEIF